MNWTTIFNPFAKISEKTLMLIGVVTFLIGCFISWKFRMIYDGVLDAHPVLSLSYVQAFTTNAVNVILMCALLFGLGKIINSKTRMIDILNASFLYRIPIYIIAVMSKIPALDGINEKVMKNISHPENINLSAGDMFFLFIFTVVSLGLLAYSIVLLVNGFKTSTNAKKWQHFVSFAFVLIAAEIVSKLLIDFL